MTEQEQALIQVATFLDAQRVAYMVIGGMANTVWGSERATLDVDVTVIVEEAVLGRFLHEVTAHFTSRVGDAEAFVASTRVLPVETSAGVGIDLILGMTPFEADAARRAVSIPVGQTPIRFCTPEDLVLLKIGSERQRDLDDVRSLVSRRLGSLDLAYLEPRVRELATLLERPEIQTRWEAWKRGGGA